MKIYESDLGDGKKEVIIEADNGGISTGEIDTYWTDRHIGEKMDEIRKEAEYNGNK